MFSKLLKIFSGSFLFIQQVNAQLCQGSLGDPIINVTFGQGSNPGAAISAAATTYLFVAGDCPIDGSYTIISSTNACFGNTWHTLNSDHTGDPGGYFMLVNASVQPGVFYLDTVKNLCGSTTYEFAAWVINMLKASSCNSAGIQPDLTFSIERTDGTLLQSFNTNNISPSATPVWKQYGFYFTTPSSVTDVVLRVTNNAPGGCGNDLALDDITFRPCGPLITGNINGQPVTTKQLCEGLQQSFTLNTNVSGGMINPVYQWQSRNSVNSSWADIPMATSNTLVRLFAQNTAPGIYEYRLAVAEPGSINSFRCRVYSQPFVFTIEQKPVITINSNSPVCEGSLLSLNANGGSQYQWSGPNGFTSAAPGLQLMNVQLSQAGKYFVSVTNAAGCTNKDSAMVTVNPAPVVTTSVSNAAICSGDSIQLLAAGASSYQWLPSKALSADNINDPKAAPLVNTQYSVVGSNQFACKDTAIINIVVHPRPIIDAGPGKIIFKGESVQLSAQVNTPGTYTWSPAMDIDNIHSLRPFVKPPASRYYTLHFVSGFGCGTSTDSTLVQVYTGIFIPNAFSPNGDNVNDTWDIAGLGVCTNFEVSVYNRWGQLVFSTKDKLRSWDGTFKGQQAPVGVYTYHIKVCNKPEALKGIVFLIR